MFAATLIFLVVTEVFREFRPSFPKLSRFSSNSAACTLRLRGARICNSVSFTLEISRSSFARSFSSLWYIVICFFMAISCIRFLCWATPSRSHLSNDFPFWPLFILILKHSVVFHEVCSITPFMFCEFTQTRLYRATLTTIVHRNERMLIRLATVVRSPWDKSFPQSLPK